VPAQTHRFKPIGGTALIPRIANRKFTDMFRHRPGKSLIRRWNDSFRKTIEVGSSPSRFALLGVVIVVFWNTTLVQGGTVIFDSYNVPATSDVGSGGTPAFTVGFGTSVSVANNTNISNIQVFNALNTPQNETFQIFDITSASKFGVGAVLEYDSGLIATAADALAGSFDEGSWKRSPDLSFTLLAGHQYAIGFESDGNFQLPTNSTLNSQNGITATGAWIFLNGGLQNFSNGFPHQFDTSIRIEADQASAVPEPSTLVTWSLAAGIFGVGGLRKRLA
jgi:hypothetical protein